MLGGAGVLVVGRYAVAALAWIGTLIIVRKLTVPEFGRFSLVLSLLGIVGFIADLKLSRIVLRDVMAADAEESGRVVGSYVGLRIVIGIVSYGVAMAWVLISAAFSSGYPPDVVQGTAIAGLNLIILSAAFGLILLFEARLWLRDVAVANVLGQVVQFAMTIGIAAAGLASILWFSWATVANAVALLAFLYIVTRRTTRVRLAIEGRQWWLWLREAAPLALGAALDTVYFRIDIVMLSLLATDAAVGIYSVGYKFSDLIGALPLAVVTPALTMMVAAWPHDPGRFRRVFRHALIILTVGAIGTSVGFFVFAQPLMLALYGARYAGPRAVDSARLLVIGQGLHFFTLLAFSTLVAAGRNKLYPIAMLVGVLANIALNIVLIPEYSFLGSGWATVVTEVFVLAVLGFGVARIPGVRPFPLAAMVKCVVAGVVTAFAGWGLLGRVPWPVGGALTALVYLGTAHVLRVNGPGGLRALGGDPRDDLAGDERAELDAIIEEGLDRPGPGEGMPG